jgi:hypothetical protein
MITMSEERPIWNNPSHVIYMRFQRNNILSNTASPPNFRATKQPALKLMPFSQHLACHIIKCRKRKKRKLTAILQTNHLIINRKHVNKNRWLKFRVFWDVAPCSHVAVDRRFRREYCLYHHRPDDGGSAHVWSVGQLQREYTAIHVRRLNFIPLPWEPEISQ